jgi:NitT/TauT family transport system permease protein
VASELVAAQQGLGYRMQIAGIYFDLPTIYFNIIVIGVLGFAMDKLLMLVEDRLLGWQER